MIANQNSDVNWATSVMEDETECEFVVGFDWFMTSSMLYCDLILPEVMPQEEELAIASITTLGLHSGTVFCQRVQKAPGECRTEFEWMADLAERFGQREEFTMGTTPSGKIEVYCEQIAQWADTWELDDPRDVICPIPIYTPGFESYEDATDEYPLLVSSWKSKIRYHSKWNQVEWLNQASRHTLWINPADAEPRDIANGDMVRVFNGRGEVRIEARVTPRIVPGAVGMEEGRMRTLDENGVDVGGCVNTLVSHHWSPLAKHNNSNSVLAQVEKL